MYEEQIRRASGGKTKGADRAATALTVCEPVAAAMASVLVECLRPLQVHAIRLHDPARSVPQVLPVLQQSRLLDNACAVVAQAP